MVSFHVDGRQLLERAAELQRAPQELPRSLLAWTVEHVGGGALLDDPAFVHQEDAVPDLAGELHLVGDDEHRHARLGEVAHDDKHLADELRVERGRDLVEEHHTRLHHQRPCDRDPLLLAARELVRMLMRLRIDADAGENLVRLSLRSRTGYLPDPARGERDVVDHAQVREEVELLEDHADALPHARNVGTAPCDLLALEPDRPGVEVLEEIHAAQKRRLAAPARPDDGQYLAGRHSQVDATQHGAVAEALVDPYELQRRLLRTADRPEVGSLSSCTSHREFEATNLRPGTVSGALPMFRRGATYPRGRGTAPGRL
jgi:hypothetical protein